MQISTDGSIESEDDWVHIWLEQRRKYESNTMLINKYFDCYIWLYVYCIAEMFD